MTTLHCFEVAEHPYSKGNLNRRPVTRLTSRSPRQHGRAQAATASGQAPNELESCYKMRASAARAAGRKPPRPNQKKHVPNKTQNSRVRTAAASAPIHRPMLGPQFQNQRCVCFFLQHRQRLGLVTVRYWKLRKIAAQKCMSPPLAESRATFVNIAHKFF